MSQQHPKIAHGEQRSADATLRCRQCEYDLRGLPEPRCPECGTKFDPNDRTTYIHLEPVDCKRLLKTAITAIALLSAWLLAALVAPYRFYPASPLWKLVIPAVGVMTLFGIVLAFGVYSEARHISDKSLAVRHPQYARIAYWFAVVAILWFPALLAVAIAIPSRVGH